MSITQLFLYMCIITRKPMVHILVSYVKFSEYDYEEEATGLGA